MDATLEETRLAQYDFRQAHSLSSDQLRELGEHCGNLCRALQRLVPESMGINAEFSLDRLVPTSYEEYLDALPDLPILAICDFGEKGQPVVWQLDTRPALAYMDAMLGGDGSAETEDERELTVLERALVHQIVEEFISTWTDSWPDLEAMAPRATDVRQTTGRLEAASLQEAVVSAIMNFEIADVHGQMRLALPTVVLRNLLKRSTREVPTSSGPNAVKQMTDSELASCPVEVSVELVRTAMTLREVRALEVGDVVMLPRGPRDLLDVAVGGIRKFHGTSGLVNGHLATRIVGEFDE